MQRLMLIFLFPAICFSMESGTAQNVSQKSAKRNFFFPNVEVAQTKEDIELGKIYLQKMLPLAMPNGLRFQMAHTYLCERAEGADLPRIVPSLKEYVSQVIMNAFSLRSAHLASNQIGNELGRAITQINTNINAVQKTREHWQYVIAPALNGYHEHRNVVLARVPTNKNDC